MARLMQLGLGALALIGMAATAEAQVGGNLAAGPPVDIGVEISTGPSGEPVLSASEFKLTTGEYYRFAVVCTDAADDETGFHVEVTDLLANSHLRIMDVNQIEFYMQGLTFRAIECDKAGTARFNFVPIRPGTYDLYVRDHSTPPQEAVGHFVVE